MAKLSKDEITLLELLSKKPSLSRYVFNNITGVRYFDELEKRGFIDPKKNPKPLKVDKKGYQIPVWDVLKYLLNTLKSEEKIEEPYIKKYLSFIQDVTEQTDPEESNYRTWWMFAQMLPYFANQLDSSFLDKCIPVWLNDRFTTSIIVDELGNKLLPQLVELDKKEAALSLLQSLLRVKKNNEGRGFESFEFNADTYWVSKFLVDQLNSISKLGQDALDIFNDQLKGILQENRQKEDFASFIWRPAIEDHEQNSDYSNKLANTLVTTIRDLLVEIDERNLLTEEHLQEYFVINLNVFKRIAIHHVNRTWPKYKTIVPNLIRDDYFKSYYKHEFYKLLEAHFDDFNEQWKEKILNIIDGFDDYSDEKYKEKQIAFNKLSWLKAVSESSNSKAKQLYKKNIEITGREPSHPSFPFYMESGFASNKSPYSVSELASLDTEELIKALNNFEEEKNQLNGPTKRGLADSFKQLLNTNFDALLNKVNNFIYLDDLYLSEVLRYFQDSIDESDKIKLANALDFCEKVVQTRHDLFKNTYSNSIDELNRFLIEITRIDKIITTDSEFRIIEELISRQLDLIKNGKSKILDTKSYLTKAINTHKGKVLETLINYALLRCRLVEKEKNGHEETWNELKIFFDNELKEERINYITTAIFSKYLPNLLYLSNSWVETNLSKLFPLDKERELWLASINGYGYSKYLDTVFDYLVDNNQLEEVFKAYDEEEIEYRIFQKYIQSIAIHYIVNDDTKGLSVLLNRKKDDELADLISYVWSSRDNLHSNYRPQIFKLWKRLFEYIKGREAEFNKSLSYLSNWSVFVTNIDAEKYQLLEQAAHYAFDSHHSGVFLEELNRLVEDHPEVTADLFLKSLENEVAYLDKSEVKKFLRQIYEAGCLKKAEDISDKFFKIGHSDITDFLIELKSENNKKL